MPFTIIDNLGTLSSSTYESYYYGNVTITATIDPLADADFYHQQGHSVKNPPALFLAPVVTTETTFVSFSFDSVLGWVYSDSAGHQGSNLIGRTTVGVASSTTIKTISNSSFSSEGTTYFYSQTDTNNTETPSAYTATGKVITAPGGAYGLISDLSILESFSYTAESINIYTAAYQAGADTVSQDTSAFEGSNTSFVADWSYSLIAETTSSSSSSRIIPYFDGLFYDYLLTSSNHDIRVGLEKVLLKFNSTEIPTTSESYEVDLLTTSTTSSAYLDQNGNPMNGPVTYYQETYPYPYNIGTIIGSKSDPPPNYTWYISTTGYSSPPFQELLTNPVTATISYVIATRDDFSYWVFLDDLGNSTACYDFQSPLPVVENREIAYLQWASFHDDFGKVFYPGKCEPLGCQRGILTSPYNGYGPVTDAFDASINGLSITWRELTTYQHSTNTATEKSYKTTSGMFSTSNQVSTSSYAKTVSGDFGGGSIAVPSYAHDPMTINLTYCGVLGVTMFESTQSNNSLQTSVTYSTITQQSTVLTATWNSTYTETTSFMLEVGKTLSLSPNGYWMTPIDTVTGIK